MVFKRKAAAREELDLNKNGRLDKADKKLAAKVLATDFKAVPEDAPKPEGRIALMDINLTYRKGMVVPESQIREWDAMGLHWQDWFE